MLKILNILCAFLLVATGARGAENSNIDIEYPPAIDICKHAPWCDFVAVEKKLHPIHSSSPLMPISNFSFNFDIPKNFEKITLLPAGITILAFFYGNYSINFTTESLKAITPNIKKNKKMDAAKANARYSPIDIFEIAFTSKSTFKEPSNLWDRVLWRAAFMQKWLRYENASDFSIYRLDKLSVYTVDIKQDNTSIAIVTSKKIPEKYMKITGSGIPKEVFLNILSSLRLEN